MQATRTVAIWIVLLALACGAVYALPGEGPVERPLAVLQEDVRAGRVASVAFGPDGAVVTPTAGEPYEVLGYVDSATYEALAESGVPITTNYGQAPWLASILSLVVPIVAVVLLLLALLYFVRRNQQQQGTNLFAMRKSTARLVKGGTEAVRFADVGGAEDAKERLADVVDLLQNPKRWTDAGVRLPRGVLLEGPPGCGKTLLARAVAGEAGVPVFVVSASEFVEMFVGVGAARIRDLFETAAKSAPCVVFIDELDAVGRRRGSGVGAAHDEREQTLNQLLVSLDGFEPQKRVVVLAATNRSDVLDAALLRPGRFDLRVTLPPLDHAARLAVLRIHTRGRKIGGDVSLEALAARTEGWSGADLEHLCNEASMAAVRRTRTTNEPAVVGAADVDRVLATRTAREVAFDRLDQVLLESASQLARPNGPAHVRLALADGDEVEGVIVWADATFLKVRPDTGDARIVAKAQIRSMRALTGTEAVAAGEQVGDRWAGRSPDLA